MISSLEAFVLHKQWLGDTSARVIFFTREWGLVQCFYKGGRTPKKQALLQIFHPLCLSLNKRYDNYYVQSLESRESSFPLVEKALIAGLYLNELLYYTQSPNVPEPDLFDAYCLTLNGLSAYREKQETETLLRRFERALLKASGIAFSWTEEAGGFAAIQSEVYYRFKPGEGFIQSTQGLLGAHILAFAADELKDAACLLDVKKIMREAIDHLLEGREIKARSLYRM